MTEILAPCGNIQAFYSAINSKADAIYLGLDDFSARKNADNFTCDNVGFYIAYAHTFNVKVYICVNTLVKDAELEKFFKLVEEAYDCGADAFILQDIFLAPRLKARFPDIILHLSTQAGVNNTDGAILAKELGFSRVVLARETRIEQITKISEIIETEVFIHGALCTSLSGHCYMSAFIGGNSGNRGFCKQPCRKKYTYSFNNKECYALSLSDLCLAEHFKQLADCKITSFKIEGRMRSSEYVETALNLYNAARAGKTFHNELETAKRAYNRGSFTKGYLFGQDKNLFSADLQGHQGVFVEKVVKFKDSKIYLSKKHLKNSGFKILRDGIEVGNGKCVEDGNFVSFTGDIELGDNVYITKDTSLCGTNIRLKEIDVRAEFFVGQTAKLYSGNICVQTDFRLDCAKTAPVVRNDVYNSLQKRDIYPFKIGRLTFFGNDAFITKSALNRLRISLFDKLLYSNETIRRKNDASINPDYFCGERKDYKKAIAVIVTGAIELDSRVTDVIFAPKDYSKEILDEFIFKVKCYSAKKYLYIPAFMSDTIISNFADLAQNFDGLYVEGLFGLRLAKRLKKEVFGGAELNIFNSLSLTEAKGFGINKICASKELSYKELKNMHAYILALGSLKMMSLMYCPNNKMCKSCQITELFTIKDFDNRIFPIRRYKTEGECRFEIFNESILTSKQEFEKMLFDFSGLTQINACRLLNDYFEIGLDGIANKYKHTNGNLLKGVY